MRPRFLAFASRAEEAGEWTRRLPDLTLTFAGHSAFQSAVLVFRPDRPGDFLDALEAEHRRAPFAGLLNRREKYVFPACLAAERLGLPPLVLRPDLVRDKLGMRLALGGEAVLLRELPLDLPQDFFPAVLKPRFGFNSRAVVRVDDPAQLARELPRQRALFSRLRRPDSASLDFIAERWFGGTEHTAETLVVDGAVRWCLLSDKMQMHPPYHVEVGDLAPSRLPAGPQDLVRQAVEEAVTRLGIRNGWAHVEVKLEAGRAVVIEAAARMGGGCHEELNREVYGLDRVRVLADLQLGRPLPAAPVPRTWVAVRRSVTDGIGYVLAPRRLRSLVEAEGARLLWPEGSASRLVVGPPFGYKNTVFELMACDPEPEGALRKIRLAESRARLWRIPLAACLYFPLRRLLRGQAPLDG